MVIASLRVYCVSLWLPLEESQPFERRKWEEQSKFEYVYQSADDGNDSSARQTHNRQMIYLRLPHLTSKFRHEVKHNQSPFPETSTGNLTYHVNSRPHFGDQRPSILAPSHQICLEENPIQAKMPYPEHRYG